MIFFMNNYTFLGIEESLEIFLPNGRRKAGFGKCSGLGSEGVQLCRRLLSVVERAHLTVMLLGGFLINGLDSCTSSRFLPCLWSLFSCCSNSTSGKWDKLDSCNISGCLTSLLKVPETLMYLYTLVLLIRIS